MINPTSPNIRFNFVFIFALLMLSSLNALAADCKGTFKDVKLEEKLATTSVYANLRGSADSIKTVSADLIKHASEGALSAAAPEGLCPESCTVNTQPTVLLSSTPNKVLTNYGDKEVCDKLFVQTSATPIKFNDKTFKDLESLNSYYSDLCQGSGTDGKELYKICHSTCSLSYKSFILKSGNTFKMDVEAVCGAARDKDDGQYLLTSYYRWTCQ